MKTVVMDASVAAKRFLPEPIFTYHNAPVARRLHFSHVALQERGMWVCRVPVRAFVGRRQSGCA